MPDTVESLGEWRTDGSYNIGVAQRLTGVSSYAIKRWLACKFCSLISCFSLLLQLK